MPKQQVHLSNMIHPAFFKTFECTGGKCPVNCCYGWGVIGWSEKEYTKLMNADMSDDLKEKTANLFTNVTDKEIRKVSKYKINYTSENKCPMLTENGLCSVQKELGAEYLSLTCRVYPRTAHISGSAFILTCQSSCVNVIHMICSSENSMKLEIHKPVQSQIENASITAPYTAQDIKDHPALNYELDIFNFLYKILSDSTRSIETSITLAAMAVKKLDEFVQKGQAEKIPAVLKALEPQLNDPVQIEKTENAKSNLSLKANFSAGLLELLRGSHIHKILFENGIPDGEKWQEGMNKFNEIYKDRPYALRNIALNIFISSRVPFRSTEHTLFENFSYFAAQVSVIKLLAASVTAQYETDKCEELFEIAISYTDRFFTHSQNNFQKIIEYMKTFGCTTPAMLLGIIK